VFDVAQKGKSESKGFIPVGWYPTNVRTVGSKIFVANGKGFTSFPNPLELLKTSFFSLLAIFSP
jgi:hypothetical protein